TLHEGAQRMLSRGHNPETRHGNYCSFIFFFNDTATTEIYTLSLHDALPIFPLGLVWYSIPDWMRDAGVDIQSRSEEHTSELQSHSDLVCRLLLEKKINKTQQQLDPLVEVESKCMVRTS